MSETIKILQECINLQIKKSLDYQNPNSNIKQADYYPSGCLTILEIMHAKLLRMRSMLEATLNDKNYKPNFESFEDSAKDLINYSSFFVAYSRGMIEGQNSNNDFLNRQTVYTATIPPNIVNSVANSFYDTIPVSPTTGL